MSSAFSLESCLPLLLGESSQSPIALMDSTEKAQIAAKLNTILAKLDNIIQFFDTPN